MTKTKATMTTADYDRIAEVINVQAQHALVDNLDMRGYEAIRQVRKALSLQFQENDPNFSAYRFICKATGIDFES